MRKDIIISIDFVLKAAAETTPEDQEAMALFRRNVQTGEFSDDYRKAFEAAFKRESLSLPTPVATNHLPEAPPSPPKGKRGGGNGGFDGYSPLERLHLESFLERRMPQFSGAKEFKRSLRYFVRAIRHRATDLADEGLLRAYEAIEGVKVSMAPGWKKQKFLGPLAAAFIVDPDEIGRFAGSVFGNDYIDPHSAAAHLRNIVTDERTPDRNLVLFTLIAAHHCIHGINRAPRHDDLREVEIFFVEKLRAKGVLR